MTSARQWGFPPGFGPSGGATGSALMGEMLWVTETNGDDATAIFGDLHHPYKTIQAAVNALIANGPGPTGLISGVIMVLDGLYDENVSITGGATSISIRFQGFGTVTSFRQLTVTASPVAKQVNVFLDNMQLGSGAGALTDHVVKFIGDVGFYSLWVTDCSFLAQDTNTVDVINENGAGAGGFTFEAHNSPVLAFPNGGVGPVTGISIGKGNAALSGSNVRGKGAPAIKLSGAANLSIRDCSITTGVAGFNAVDNTGSGTVALQQIDAEVEAASTGHLVGDSTAAATGGAALLNCQLNRAGGSGGISMPAGAVTSTAATDDATGLLLPVTSVTQSAPAFNASGLAVGANQLSGSEVFRVAGDGRYEGNQLVLDDQQIQLGNDSDYTIQFDSGSDDLFFASNNANGKWLFDLGSNNATSDFRFRTLAGTTILRMDGANRIGFFGASPMGQSAAYTPTNVAADRSYDADATTIDELADVLGTLIADLQATGLIG